MMDILARLCLEKPQTFVSGMARISWIRGLKEYTKHIEKILRDRSSQCYSGREHSAIVEWEMGSVSVLPEGWSWR